jgi:hypothetical protein
MRLGETTHSNAVGKRGANPCGDLLKMKVGARPSSSGREGGISTIEIAEEVVAHASSGRSCNVDAVESTPSHHHPCLVSFRSRIKPPSSSSSSSSGHPMQCTASTGGIHKPALPVYKKGGLA